MHENRKFNARKLVFTNYLVKLVVFTNYLVKLVILKLTFTISVHFSPLPISELQFTHLLIDIKRHAICMQQLSFLLQYADYYV